MPYEKRGHVIKLPIDMIGEDVDAEPQVAYSNKEIENLLKDLQIAVKEQSYVPSVPTQENPALSDEYIFDANDESFILKDLTIHNFVGKVKDVGKGAKKRILKGLPQEYLYVFKYPCRLMKRDAKENEEEMEDMLIYIKVNNRKIPYEKVFVISFHKNRPKR